MCRKFIHFIPYVLVLGWVLMGAAQAADPSLVGWWKLDETNGLTAADSSGNNNNGTLTNLRGDQWVKGIKDGGLDFIPPGYVNCGAGTSLNLAKDADFTIAAWVKLAENTSGNYGGIAGRLFATGDLVYTGFGLVRHSGNTFRLWVGDNTTDLAKSAVSSNTTYTDTAWHHVLGLRKNGSNYLYVDGVKQTATTVTPFVQSTDFFHIGRQYSHLDDRYFIGVIDDVRLYNRALTGDEITALAFAPKARDPKPADGAVGVSAPLLCEWTAGSSAAFHDVYFGTTPTLGPAELKSPRQMFLVYFYPGMLTPGTVYYWRVDEVEADGVTIHTGDVWSFTATPLTAYNPSPKDGAQNVWPAVQLKWGSGVNATQHHLYFGDSLSDVASGVAGTDKGTLTEATLSSGPLAPETTYYWRVDEFDGSASHSGGIWSFTTSVGGSGILREYWLAIGAGTAVADLTNNRLYPDKPTGSEILNTFEGPVDYMDNYGSRLRGWLMPPDSGDYTFWIASDDFSELWLSTDADPANKQQIANVPGWTPSRDFDNTQGGVGGPSQKSAAISLTKGSAYYIEALMKEGGGGDNIAVAWQGPGISGRQIISSNYVSLAAFAPVRAYSPRPVNLATEVTDTPTLRWKAGAKAAKHNVYLGTDATGVTDATTATTGIYRGQQNLDATSYVPTENPLAWNSTYYWRIDEVNAADTWKGNVWSFTTASYIIVDNFEDYTDDVGGRIFQTWKDGWGYTQPPPGYAGNGTGSAVGNSAAPYAEQTTVHSGSQSMPLGYDNSGTTGKARYSETFRELASAQKNWTRNNVKALTLYFYGDPANAPEGLYVALEDDAGHIKVVNHPDPEAVQGAGWQEWNIELTQFSAGGVNLAAIKKMYIGLGNRTSPTAGGTGKIYIDDIRVHPSRCVVGKPKPAADLSGNCIVDESDVEILANLWLDTGFQVTPVNPVTTGLIAHYPFDGNANDVVGGHNGAVIGVPTYTTGKIGQAILLNGVDNYVRVGSVGISGAAPRTVSGWAKSNSTKMPDWTNIFGFTGTDDANLTARSFDIELRGGQLQFCIHVYGWEDNILPLDLEWHHLAVTYDGTMIRWYGDGRYINSYERSGDNALNTEDTVHMGRRGDTGEATNFFPGKVDDVKIWNRALTGPEIAWLAGYTSPVSIPADLQQDDVINFKDFAKLADSWLEEVKWP